MKPEVEALVAWWLPVLGLSHWRVKVEIVEFNGTWAGEMETDYVYGNAVLRIADGLPATFTEHRSIEETVVHELAHVLLDPMRSNTYDIIARLPKGTRKFPRNVAHESEERVVDNLARTLVALKAGDFNGIGGIIREEQECTSSQG